MRRKELLRHLIWTEGKYVDFWSIPHFIAGMLLALVSIYLRIPFYPALIITIFIKSGWEIYERNKVIKEPVTNQIMDVVTGVLGFLLMTYLYNRGLVPWLVQVLLFLVWFSMIYWGFSSMGKLSSNKKILRC